MQFVLLPSFRCASRRQNTQTLQSASFAQRLHENVEQSAEVKGDPRCGAQSSHGGGGLAPPLESDPEAGKLQATQAGKPRFPPASLSMFRGCNFPKAEQPRGQKWRLQIADIWNKPETEKPAEH